MARILFVDDDESFLEALCDLLTSRGHTVIPCSEPLKAAEIADQAPPQIAVLDFDMPHLNGLELLQELRRRKNLARLPAIFLSGVDAMRVAAVVPPDRHVMFLRKPVDMKELEGAIRDLLDPNSWANAT
jgi:chemosensory pili system protein ChpA (sensor histidine kinase/response regulator)